MESFARALDRIALSVLLLFLTVGVRADTSRGSGKMGRVVGKRPVIDCRPAVGPLGFEREEVVTWTILNWIRY